MFYGILAARITQQDQRWNGLDSLVTLKQPTLRELFSMNLPFFIKLEFPRFRG